MFQSSHITVKQVLPRLTSKSWLFLSSFSDRQNHTISGRIPEQKMPSDEVIEVIGGQKNFWLYSKSKGYDLTHPKTPTSLPVYPRVPLQTRSEPIAIDPTKTALVVIDLQNYFVSPALGRPKDAVGMKVVDNLLNQVIPACRTAEIPIVWLGWGLTDDDIEAMPPTIIKGFAADNNFSGEKKIKPLGEDIGSVKMDDGLVVEAGRSLVRDTWNSESYGPLKETQQPQDMIVYKNRLNGFWGGTDIEGILDSRGIRTLLFSGANTDQCVGGSMQDAFTKGWDCLMLSDGCATSSPDFAKQCIEFNTDGGWGFLLSCDDFVKGVANTQSTPGGKL